MWQFVLKKNSVSGMLLNFKYKHLLMIRRVCWFVFAEMSDYMDKVDRLKCLVLNMPPPNHDTLRFMCRHLKR